MTTNGIEVDESGSIKFKGKAVIAMTLDGANLFNANYSVGTRNIDPTIVDQVQAIENWSDNPVLKGLNADSNIAINLKLKKNKASFSSSITAATDFYERLNVGGYGLLVNSLMKSFVASAYNNVGENKSPVNLSSKSLSLEDINTVLHQTPEFITTSAVNTQLGLQKTNINKQWFNSVNTIFNIGPKANIKFIGTTVADKIVINNMSECNYTLIDYKIVTKDENSNAKTL